MMSRWMIVLGGVVVLLAIMVGTVSAEQGVLTSVQINNAENGFLGGDTLHCSSEGCVLRNKDGVELGHYDNRPLDTYWYGGNLIGDIDYSLALCARDARNTPVRFKTNNSYYSNKKHSSDRPPKGTHGLITLWAIYNGPNANPTCSLQLNGYTEPGKPVQFTFTMNTDGTFNPLPVPVKEEPAIQPGFGGIS